MADPSDVADVCLFLASPLARYVTGESIVVHGGGEWPAYMSAATPPAGGDKP
jgi:NAD(P)-dependent dehydrogenase (short-subunit alcohol dehydrogenase family)